MTTIETKLTKPLLRGHFHQAAFFIALGACAMLLSRTHDLRTFLSMFIYSLSLTGLFAISALYHRPNWTPEKRMWMRRLDHAAIYILIAGTGTPIFVLAMPDDIGTKLLIITWVVAVVGMIQSLILVNLPKWVSSVIYTIAGGFFVPFLSDLHAHLGTTGIVFILTGGVFYGIGAVIYAVKRPNPWPKTFGYHEIFHLLVIVGAIFHFMAVIRVLN